MDKKKCRWCGGWHIDMLEHETNCVMRPENEKAYTRRGVELSEENKALENWERSTGLKSGY